MDVAVPNPKVILVIGDDASLAPSLRHCLERDGYGVVAAPIGADAYELVRGQAPALIVIDLAVAGALVEHAPAAGWEIFERLRRSIAVPIIVVGERSSSVAMAVPGGSRRDGIAALELGADDYVARPLNPSELAARVRAVLRRRRAAMPAPLTA